MSPASRQLALTTVIAFVEVAVAIVVAVRPHAAWVNWTIFLPLYILVLGALWLLVSFIVIRRPNRVRRPMAFVALPLGLLVLLDAGIFAGNFNNFAYTPFSNHPQHNAIMKFLEKDGGIYRIHDDTAQGAYGQFNDSADELVDSIDGQDSLVPFSTTEVISQARQWLDDPQGRTLLNELNVKYVLVNQKQLQQVQASPVLKSQFTKVYSSWGIYVLRNKDAYPRVWVAGNSLSTTGEVTSHPQSISVNGTSTVAHVDLSHGHYVVLSQMTYPGWNVFIDGKAAPLVQQYGFLDSVFVPAGAHTIEWRFEPKVLTYGYMASVFGLLVVALTSLLSVRRKV